MIKKRKIEESMINLITLTKGVIYRIKTIYTAWKKIELTVMLTTLNWALRINASVN